MPRRATTHWRPAWAVTILAALVLAGCTSAHPTAATPPASTSSSSASAPASSSSSAAQSTPGPPPSPFGERGVIEGFYGPPWSEAATLDVLSFMGRHDMNTFVYDPKNDNYSRADWRQPYPAAELGSLGRMAAGAKDAGVRFVYGIDPGMDITYSSQADRSALAAKIAQLRSIGVHAFVLALDDVPAQLDAADQAVYPGGYAQAQVDLANWLWQTERALDPAFSLIMVPTEYHGTTATPYLTELAKLDPAIGVAWTGPGVVEASITAAQAAAFGAIIGRKPLVWLNWPVNDWTTPWSELEGSGPVQPRDLFLGPVQGLDPQLGTAVTGVLANPMLEPHASLIPLASLAAYLQDPSGNGGQGAWAAEIRRLGGSEAQALETFCMAEQPYPTINAQGDYARTSTDPSVDALEQQVLAAYGSVGASALRQTAAQDLADTFKLWQHTAPELAPSKLADASLGAEIAPWVGVMSRDGQDGLDALALLAAPTSGTAQTHLEADIAQLAAQPVNFGGQLLPFLRSAQNAARAGGG